MATSTSSPTSVRAESAATNFRKWRESAEDYIREKPARAAAQAALVGYTLHLIPIRAAVAALSRLAIPAIFAVGLYQVVESFRSQPPRR